jgi:VanZ family protein
VCVAFLGLLCANIDELLQKYTERGSEVSDVFIDFGGVVIGILLGHAIVWTVGAAIKRKKEKTTDPWPLGSAAEQ